MHYLSKNQGVGDEKFLLDHIAFLSPKSGLFLAAPVFEMLHKCIVAFFTPFSFSWILNLSAELVTKGTPLAS